jgi:very-short-patch-repair endonuclease
VEKKLTEAQILLGQHLRELGIETVFGHQFAEGRRFRFDLASLEHRLGFECNGSFSGLHGPRWSSNDSEKMNLAQAQGWRVFVFSNRQVLKGQAKQWIAEHLNGGKP